MNKVRIKEIENIEKYQTEIFKLKNTITELKSSVEGFKSRLDQAEIKDQQSQR